MPRAGNSTQTDECNSDGGCNEAGDLGSKPALAEQKHRRDERSGVAELDQEPGYSEVEPRRDFIEKNALTVSNLDV